MRHIKGNPTTDDTKIDISNDPDMSLRHYTGKMNKMDRDCWNESLLDRTFSLGITRPTGNIGTEKGTRACSRDISNYSQKLDRFPNNIQHESTLFGLDYLNNKDCKENVQTKVDPDADKNMYNTYFADKEHVYPNMTCKMFNNNTKRSTL